jgi:hypothetical protein
MESMQRQILELHYKVDQLYRIIEGLSNKIADATEPWGERGSHAHQKDVLAKDSQPTSLSNHTVSKRQKANKQNIHKDILDDSNNGREYYQKSDLEELLSPDVQIQRLTAQLTASYHRIAALEEQLLAVRSKI